MKKLLPIILALMILLTACGALGNNNAPVTSPTLSSMPTVASEVEDSTFCVLLTDYKAAIDPWLAADGLTTISRSIRRPKYVTSSKEYAASPTRGLSVVILTELTNDEIQELFCRLDLDAADENTVNAFLDICKATVYGLDFDIAETILFELDYTNTTDGIWNEYDSAIAEYVFHIEDNIVELFIRAK